ncbi:MAG: orotate phosphoribosyltransferase [Chitinophagales bacterium]
MLFDIQIAAQFTEKLLEIEAIKLNPNKPFTWASGWRSPIYCDNRLTLSYPAIRKFIKNNLAEIVRQKFPQTEIVAGVATAGIPHGLLVAEHLGLPFIYVRSEAKKHGLTNLIEGKLAHGNKVVVIEDLISTGGSSLKAVEAVRNAGGYVTGLAALFSYAIDIAEHAFHVADCPFYTITDYPNIIQYAITHGILPANTQILLESWRKNPEVWTN